MTASVTDINKAIEVAGRVVEARCWVIAKQLAEVLEQSNFSLREKLALAAQAGADTAKVKVTDTEQIIDQVNQIEQGLDNIRRIVRGR